MRDYNSQAQPELGGRSPDQTAQLLHGGAERWIKHAEFRRTALFGRLLRCEFRGEWRGDVFLWTPRPPRR